LLMTLAATGMASRSSRLRREPGMSDVCPYTFPSRQCSFGNYRTCPSDLADVVAFSGIACAFSSCRAPR
jgi:hypothetical protein